jgi:hypothetical protein
MPRWFLSFQVSEVFPQIPPIGGDLTLQSADKDRLRHALRMLGDAEVDGGLHQDLNRWQATPENQFGEGLRAMLF